MKNYEGKMFLTSDWHFGKLSSNIDKWFPSMEKWAMEWFLPLLKKQAKNGDFLVIAGDIFDNQETIHIKIKEFMDNYIYTISKILPVHIIEGNHDLLDGGDSGISASALSHYKFFPNVYLHQTSHTLNWGKNKVLLQPWIRNRQEFLSTVKNIGGDILIAHTDIKGCKRGHKTPPLLDGLETKDFPFKKVYSGHIHQRQRLDNFLFIGSPYHLDISDMSDDKGVWILEPNDGAELFVENKLSPRYLEYKITDIKQIDEIDQDIINNNWCDLYLHANVPLQHNATKKVAELLKWQWKRYYRYGFEIEESKDSNSISDTFSMDSEGIKKIAIKRISSIEDSLLKEGITQKLDNLFDIFDNKKKIEDIIQK